MHYQKYNKVDRSEVKVSSGVKRIFPEADTAANDSNPDSLSRESDALPTERRPRGGRRINIRAVIAACLNAS